MTRRGAGLPPIPILFLIDCEPDLREIPRGRALPWSGFERFHDFIASRRPDMAQATGQPAHVNWFWRMDPQIELGYGAADWAIRRYAAEIAETRRHGDAIGLHTHAWRWSEEIGRWVADHGNAAWIETCIRRSVAAYRAGFGRDCAIFRFGDGWFDAALIPLLEELGIAIDLTVEPGIGAIDRVLAHEISTGRIPDRRNALRLPYRPAREDFRRADASGRTRLWELPVSTDALVRRPKLRHPRRLLRWLRSTKRKPVALSLEIAVRHFPKVFDRAIFDRAAPYVALSMRTDAGSSAARLAVMARNLAAILEHPQAARFRFMTATEALQQLASPQPPAIS